jgi:hypothetical protein
VTAAAFPDQARRPICIGEAIKAGDAETYELALQFAKEEG